MTTNPIEDVVVAITFANKGIAICSLAGMVPNEENVIAALRPEFDGSSAKMADVFFQKVRIQVRSIHMLAGKLKGDVIRRH
jgi:hypothetical protein